MHSHLVISVILLLLTVWAPPTATTTLADSSLGPITSYDFEVYIEHGPDLGLQGTEQDSQRLLSHLERLGSMVILWDMAMDMGVGTDPIHRPFVAAMSDSQLLTVHRRHFQAGVPTPTDEEINAVLADPNSPLAPRASVLWQFMLFDSSEAAGNATQELGAGVDFQEVAQALAITPQQSSPGSVIGPTLCNGNLHPSIEVHLETLAIGEISPVIDFANGPVIVKVLSRELVAQQEEGVLRARAHGMILDAARERHLTEVAQGLRESFRVDIPEFTADSVSRETIALIVGPWELTMEDVLVRLQRAQIAGDPRDPAVRDELVPDLLLLAEAERLGLFTMDDRERLIRWTDLTQTQEKFQPILIALLEARGITVNNTRELMDHLFEEYNFHLTVPVERIRVSSDGRVRILDPQ